MFHRLAKQQIAKRHQQYAAGLRGKKYTLLVFTFAWTIPRRNDQQGNSGV